MNHERKLDKLNEACKMVNQMNRAFRGVYADALRTIKLGSIPSEKGMPERNPVDDLESLVAIELPEFSNECQRLHQSRNDLGRLLTDAVMATSIDRTLKAPSEEDLRIELERAEAAVDDFLKKAYATVRTLQ